MDAKGHACVKNSPLAGRGLFAKKTLKAGELIFRLDAPLVGSIDKDRLQDTCSNCYAWKTAPSISNEVSNSVRACSACKMLGFCGKRCQSASWKKYHKNECKIFSNIPLESRNALPNAARASIQLLTMRAKGQLSEGEWSSLQQLQSHLKEQRAKMGESFEAMARGIWKYSGVEGVLGLDEAQFIFGLVLTNSLTLTTPSFDPIGVCFDPFTAIANHSCDPNAFVVMDGPIVTFRALNPISADEEITIAYVDVTNPFYRRQHELSSRYFFRCRCTKCQKGPTLPQDGFESVSQSTVAKWREAAEKVEKQEKLSTYPENKVSDDPSSSWLATFQGLAFRHLEDAGKFTPEQAIPVLKEGIVICTQAEIFSNIRQPLPSLRHDLMINFLSTGQYEDAFLNGVKLYFDTTPILYPQNHHPLRVIHNWTMAKLAIYLASECQKGDHRLNDIVQKTGINYGIIAHGFLMDTLTELPWSHGEDCSLSREAFQRFNEIQNDLSRIDPGLLEQQKQYQWEIMKELARRMQDKKV